MDGHMVFRECYNIGYAIFQTMPSHGTTPTGRGKRATRRPASLAEMVLPSDRRRRGTPRGRPRHPTRARAQNPSPRQAVHTATSAVATNDPAIRNITGAEVQMQAPVEPQAPAQPPVQPQAPAQQPTGPAPFDAGALTASILQLVERKVEEVMERVAGRDKATDGHPPGVADNSGQQPTGRGASGTQSGGMLSSNNAIVNSGSNVSNSNVDGSQDNPAMQGHLSQGGMPSNDQGSGLITSALLQASPSVPLYYSVPLKIKEKIWNNEFVDLSTVFINRRPNTNSPSDTAPPSRRFINIEQWTDAFATYSSVYRQKYPETAEPLAQYCANVRAIAKARGNWYHYDVEFRTLRQHQPFPWESIHHHLYMTALSQKQPFRPNGPRQRQSNRPTCHKYNRGQNCQSCDYPHRCRFCFGQHPSIKCWKREPTGSSPSPSPDNRPIPPRHAQPQRPAQPRATMPASNRQSK